MKRLALKMVFSGLVTAWRFAIWPTSTSPFSPHATTLGVMSEPSSFTITLGSRPSMMATTLFVVPRSMPMMRLMTFAHASVVPSACAQAASMLRAVQDRPAAPGPAQGSREPRRSCAVSAPPLTPSCARSGRSWGAWLLQSVPETTFQIAYGPVTAEATMGTLGSCLGDVHATVLRQHAEIRTRLRGLDAGAAPAASPLATVHAARARMLCGRKRVDWQRGPRSRRLRAHRQLARRHGCRSTSTSSRAS